MATKRNMEKIILVLLVLFLSNCGSPSSRTPKIRAADVWSRPAVVIEDEIGGIGVVYLTLINDGSLPDRLVSIESDVSKKVEIHRTILENGIVIMQPVKEGLEVPSGGQVEFIPGSSHIMLIGLKRNLEAGDKFKMILTFEKSGILIVESEVRQP